MKYIIPIFILLANSLTTLAQQNELKEILNKINIAVGSTPAGQYTLNEDYKKSVPGQKPVHLASVSTLYFKINSKDKVIGYKLAAVRNDSTYHKIYDGTTIVELSEKIATVTDARKYPDEVKRLRSDELLFPFIISANIFLQQYKADSLINKMQLLPEEVVNGEKCWKLMPQMEGIGNKKVKVYYYINQTSFLPVKAVTESRVPVGKVIETTVFTHAIEQLKKYKVADSVFTISAMSGYNSVKEFSGAGNASNAK